MWIPTLRSLKKELSHIKQEVTIVEEIEKQIVLFYITPQKIGRPSLEIFQRLEKI